jgi:hypothetical protein
VAGVGARVSPAREFDSGRRRWPQRRGLRRGDGSGWTMRDPRGALGPREDARGAGWKGDASPHDLLKTFQKIPQMT